MDRDVALRLDGMLINIRGALDALAHYSKGNVSEGEFKKIKLFIGGSMASTIEISTMLHTEHPDTIPSYLIPPA